MTGEIRGEIEDDDGVIVIKRIHATYRLQAPESARQTVERVHAMHRDYCPVYRSIHKAIDITTSYEIVPPATPKRSAPMTSTADLSGRRPSRTRG